jgi:hypothetical protein
MVRAVKTKTVRSLGKGQRALVLPGPTEAEPWEVWVLSGKAEPQIVQVCQSPIENRLRKMATLALPVARVHALSLWLNETDHRQIAGMIPLQIELRGLQPRNGPAVFDWSIVAREEKRTLVLVGVLPAVLPPELHAEAYDTFEVSARCFPLQPNALTLWREHDRLVAAFTRGQELAYFQALGEGTATSRLLQDLSCVKATLEMHDVLLPLERVVLWCDLPRDDRTALQTALNVPVMEEEGPPPENPKPGWKLTPSVVGEARRTREGQRWFQRGAILLLLFYLGLVGWFVTRYVMLSSQVAQLRQWQADHQPALDLVTNGRASWRQLSPIVDVKHYPLELLLDAQASIPADQLHLIEFDVNSNGKLLIKGEARNVAGAFLFFQKLKGEPLFSVYNLQMENPRALPNDLASFQIQGNRETANP